MRNGRLVPCILAVLSVVAAFFLAFAAPANAEPCPDKQVPAAAGGFCVSGGPPSPAPTSSATAPAGPASPGPEQGGAGPADAQPAVSGAETVPSQESVAGQGSAPAPAASAGPPSAANLATSLAGSASPQPSRSARTLTAAPPDSGRAEAGGVPLAGYLVAIGGGMLLLSSAFGFMRFRPAAR